jgi:hypothetical protein
MKKKEFNFKFEFDFKPNLGLEFHNPHQTTIGIKSNLAMSTKKTKKTTQTQAQVLEP